MKEIKTLKGTLYVAEDLVENYQDNPEKMLNVDLEQTFLHTPLFKTYFETYGEKNNLSKLAILDAHGSSKDKEKWMYWDGDEKYLVQDWIDEKDGKYSGLILRVCNDHGHTPRSKKSTLVVPNRGEIINSFNLIVPNVGEIDEYTIEYELEKLKSS